MPSYTYRFEDGTTIEVQQSITEDAHELLPNPNMGDAMQPVKRVPQLPVAKFKGQGWARG